MELNKQLMPQTVTAKCKTDRHYSWD